MAATTGVLLLQLGTPDEPTPRALRRYLRQFLGDRRVIDLPRPFWLPVLTLRVLPSRAPASAELYRNIWTAEGSPLLAITRAQAGALAARLEAIEGRAVPVAIGMRYGSPSIASAVDALLLEGADRILAMPMYPQYASATTGSSLQELFEVLGRRRVVPPLRVVPPYGGDPLYVDALGARAREALAAAAPDHVVVSFHGLPERYVRAGDPYARECEETFERLAETLAWPRDRMTLTYQSRFGREPWLQPYTDETLSSLRDAGVRRVAVMCPGFTADCLETLEEMGITNRKLFVRDADDRYDVIPCLNDDARWIDAMTALVMREAGGWIEAAAGDAAAFARGDRQA